ncbi:fluoride efflux transporter CrcB [Halalkalibacter okhensis]|uniref:Fluoride-specific ion channel FluC n=1 Tax=Halalkalibacter okhensis TaxID=333138 RepID=A0A0B0ICF8_9BACI|nr:fluoride efflux transporter CrcB [Halalkalibacter okhensis]KHF38577.1 chromosome condensation protein CrcB [Halalkalibacter okhensis]
MNLLLVSVGGMLGAICRYVLGIAIMSKFPTPPFPIAMLIVNVLGSLGLGVFYGSYYGGIPLGAYEESVFLLVAIGFFGAFTTFSTFSMETVQLYQKSAWKPLLAYISLSIVGSITMFVFGFSITK